MAEAESVDNNEKTKVWNLNFFLLWQGQFVSAVGDVVYEIALGFWILAMTGSTALMGTLMAASTIPRVLLGPFAGSFALIGIYIFPQLGARGVRDFFAVEDPDAIENPDTVDDPNGV